MKSVADSVRMRKSPNFKHGVFHNLSPTPVMAEGTSLIKVLRENLRRPKTVCPSAALPSQKTDISHSTGKPTITWFGHSSYLIQINNKNILVDPVFSGHASPLSWLVKAFPGTDIYSTDDFPDIDMLIITHNHFDHLDLRTVRKLKTKIKHVYTSLGTARNIGHIDTAFITELDWWQSVKISADIELTALPARHFSGRGIKRNASLWCSFALSIHGFSIYIGGDSGYDSHFKKIGDQYGPFDIALLECGQYNPAWPYIHMMPEQTAQAALDLKAKVLMPVHWGKFALANHPWNEPVKRLQKKAAELQVRITTPRIGEQIILNEHYPADEWWVMQ